MSESSVMPNRESTKNYAMKIEKEEDDNTKSNEHDNCTVNSNKHSNDNESTVSKMPKLYKLNNNNINNCRSSNYGDKQASIITAGLRLLNYNSLLCDDIALPQRPERALLAPYYTYGCIGEQYYYDNTFAICSNYTKLETKVKEEKGQNDDSDVTLTTSECKQKQCVKKKKRAVNKAKTASRKVKENKYHNNSNCESNNDINNSKAMMLSLSSSDWLNTIPHVVIGRHSLLPPAYRVTFPFISRAHIKIVYVSTNKLHYYFINCYKCIERECNKYVFGSVKKENTNLHTSPIEFTQPYYLLINYSDNMLYVNDNAISKHTSIVLTEGDIISFLEKAWVTGSSDDDCTMESNAISENNKTCNYYNSDIDDKVKKTHNELKTINQMKCKFKQADNMDDSKSYKSTFLTNETAVKAEPVYIDVDDDMKSIDSVVNFDRDSNNNINDNDDDDDDDDNDMKEPNTLFKKIMHSNQCLHITSNAKYLLHWIDEHFKSNLIELETKTSLQVKIKTEIEIKKETPSQRISLKSIIEFTNVLANVLQLESPKMSSSSSSLESLHIPPIQSILDINKEAVIALLEILRKELQLIKSVISLSEEYQVEFENNELHNLQSRHCDALKAHTLSSLLRYKQLDDNNSNIECIITKLMKSTDENYDNRIRQWQNCKEEMCECLASLFTLVPAQLPVFVFTCKQWSNAWKHGDFNYYHCGNNHNNKNGICYIINNKERDYKDKYHGNNKTEEQNNALNYVLNKLHIQSCNNAAEEFRSVAADPFTPLSISHEESLQLPCADQIYKTSTLTLEELYNNRRQQRTQTKNTSRSNINSSSYYYYYYYYDENQEKEKEEEQEREQQERQQKQWEVTNKLLTNQSMQKAVSSCKSEFVRCQHKAVNKSYAVSETREGRSKYARHEYAHWTAHNIEQPTKSNNPAQDKINTNNINNKESGYIIHDNDDIDITNNSDSVNDDANSNSIEEFWKDETTDALFRPKRRRRRRHFR